MSIDGLLHVLCNQLVASRRRLDEVHPEVLVRIALDHAVIPLRRLITITKQVQGLGEAIGLRVVQDLHHVAEDVVVDDLLPKLAQTLLDGGVG